MCVIPCKQNAELKTKIDSLDVGDGLGRISMVISELCVNE